MPRETHDSNHSDTKRVKTGEMGVFRPAKEPTNNDVMARKIARVGGELKGKGKKNNGVVHNIETTTPIDQERIAKRSFLLGRSTEMQNRLRKIKDAIKHNNELEELWKRLTSVVEDLNNIKEKDFRTIEHELLFIDKNLDDFERAIDLSFAEDAETQSKLELLPDLIAELKDFTATLAPLKQRPTAKEINGLIEDEALYAWLLNAKERKIQLQKETISSLESTLKAITKSREIAEKLRDRLTEEPVADVHKNEQDPILSKLYRATQEAKPETSQAANNMSFNNESEVPVKAKEKVAVALPTSEHPHYDEHFDGRLEKSRLPGEIVTPYIRKNSNSTSAEDLFYITHNKEKVYVPSRFWKTLDLYRNYFANNKLQDKAMATSLKNELLSHVEQAEFDKADEDLEQLSSLFDSKLPGNEEDVIEDLSSQQGVTSPDKKAQANPETPTNYPLRELINTLDIRVLQKPKAQGEREKRNITEDVQLSEKLTAWEKTWLVSGKLDVFRKKYGNIAISEEQINSTKRLLAIYLTKLHNITEGKVVRESLQSISTNSIELVKILAGIHNEQLSDIKYLVENFSLAQDNALAAKLMEKEEEGAVELPETVSSSSSSEKASTRNNEEAPSIIDNLQESAVSRQGFKEMEEQTFIELIDLRKKTADLIRLIAPYSKDSDMQALLATQKLLKEQELALSRAKTKDGLEEFDARVLAFNKTVRDLARRIDQILEEEASATTVAAEEPSTEDEPTVTAPPSNPFLRRLTPTIEEGNKTVVDVDARDITEYETRDEATEAIKKSQTSSRRPFDVFKNFMRTGVKTNEIKDLVQENTYNVETFVFPEQVFTQKNETRTPREILSAYTQENKELDDLIKKIRSEQALGTAIGNPEEVLARIEERKQEIKQAQAYWQAIVLGQKPAPIEDKARTETTHENSPDNAKERATKKLFDALSKFFMGNTSEGILKVGGVNK